MKKSILTLAVLGLTAAGSFAQGYFLFAGSKGATWDVLAPNTVGSSTPQFSSGDVTVSFLIGNTLGSSASATNAIDAATATQYNALISGLGSTYSQAVNSANSTVVSVLSSSTTPAKGGWSYNGGATFQVANTPGASYTVQAIAWAGTSLATATAFGWGNSFTYSPGASALATPPTFTAAGSLPFGVAPIPEPTSFALAGIGAAAMMIFRRKK